MATIVRQAIVIAEWALIGLFGVLFLILVFDLPSAWNAQNCSILPITQGCYPWGGEGPVADAGWNYASKRNYLASGFYTFGIATAVLALMFVLRPGRRIFVLIVGFVMMRAGQYFLPFVV